MYPADRLHGSAEGGFTIKSALSAAFCAIWRMALHQFWVAAGVMTAFMAVTPVWLFVTGDFIGAVVVGAPSAILLFAMVGLVSRLAKS